MPETLDRCVIDVQAKGHSEASAYAICRASLGLMSDGTEDEKAVEIDPDEMKRRVEMALAFQKGPVLRKRMMIASPIGEFQNGPSQKETIGRERLAEIVRVRQ